MILFDFLNVNKICVLSTFWSWQLQIPITSFNKLNNNSRSINTTTSLIYLKFVINILSLFLEFHYIFCRIPKIALVFFFFYEIYTRRCHHTLGHNYNSRIHLQLRLLKNLFYLSSFEMYRQSADSLKAINDHVKFEIHAKSRRFLRSIYTLSFFLYIYIFFVFSNPRSPAI